MKGSVLFLSKHAAAASTRYRVLQYLPLLEQLGWQCHYLGVNKSNLKEKKQLLSQCRHHDIVVVQRKLFDPVSFFLVNNASHHLVFDYDDAIFLNSDGSASKRRHKRFTKTTQACQLTLAGNDYLAAASACLNSQQLPTCITLADYPRVKDFRSTPNKGIMLVWIGSRSTKKYLEYHRDTFETIGKTFSQITLKIISDFELHFNHLETQCVPWSKTSELEQLLSADVGIAPMIDDPWTKGKCGLKVIQYMACGLPVISCNSGANKEIILSQRTGFLANNTEDWLNAIDDLHATEKKQSMGAEGRKRVETHYCAEALSQHLDRYLSDVLNRSKR